MSEPKKVIYARITKKLHDAFTREAKKQNLSIAQLIESTLKKFIDSKMFRGDN